MQDNGNGLDTNTTNPSHLNNLLNMNWGFGLLFLLAGSLQQFLTVHFAEMGIPDLGFKLLFVLYVSVILSLGMVAKITNVLGKKNVLLLSTFCYLITGIAACQNNTTLLYISFSLMGIGCSLLWSTQNILLFDNSTKNNIGYHAGKFQLFTLSGTLIGMTSFGLALNFLTFETIAIIFTAIASTSIIFFLKLKTEKNSIKNPDKFLNIIKNGKYVLFSSISFVCFFLYGIAIAFLPLQTHLASHNALLTTFIPLIFFVVKVFFSSHIGILIDKKGVSLMSKLAALFAIAGFSMLWYEINIFSLTISAFLLGLSSAILIPIAMVLPKLISPPEAHEALLRLFMYAKYFGIVFSFAIGAINSSDTLLIISFSLSLAFLLVANYFPTKHSS